MVVLVHPFRPLIRKLPDGINSGNGASIAADSIQRWRNNESDGVGLGIVAALEKGGGGGGGGGDPLVKLKFRVTAPIPIVSPRAARDFLSHCCLCRKELHGKDIYMYRGEKAFCSMECRYKQMVSDEYQEKCGSEVAKKPEISVSPPYTGGGRLFFTGIVVR